MVDIRIALVMMCALFVSSPAGPPSPPAPPAGVYFKIYPSGGAGSHLPHARAKPTKCIVTDKSVGPRLHNMRVGRDTLNLVVDYKYHEYCFTANLSCTVSKRPGNVLEDFEYHHRKGDGSGSKYSYTLYSSVVKYAHEGWWVCTAERTPAPSGHRGERERKGKAFEIEPCAGFWVGVVPKTTSSSASSRTSSCLSSDASSSASSGASSGASSRASSDASSRALSSASSRASSHASSHAPTTTTSTPWSLFPRNPPLNKSTATNTSPTSPTATPTLIPAKSALRNSRREVSTKPAARSGSSPLSTQLLLGLAVGFLLSLAAFVVAAIFLVFLTRTYILKKLGGPARVGGAGAGAGSKLPPCSRHHCPAARASDDKQAACDVTAESVVGEHTYATGGGGAPAADFKNCKCKCKCINKEVDLPNAVHVIHSTQGAPIGERCEEPTAAAAGEQAVAVTGLQGRTCNSIGDNRLNNVIAQINESPPSPADGPAAPDSAGPAACCPCGLPRASAPRALVTVEVQAPSRLWSCSASSIPRDQKCHIL